MLPSPDEPVVGGGSCALMFAAHNSPQKIRMYNFFMMISIILSDLYGIFFENVEKNRIVRVVFNYFSYFYILFQKPKILIIMT